MASRKGRVLLPAKKKVKKKTLLQNLFPNSLQTQKQVGPLQGATSKASRQHDDSIRLLLSLLGALFTSKDQEGPDPPLQEEASNLLRVETGQRGFFLTFFPGQITSTFSVENTQRSKRSENKSLLTAHLLPPSEANVSRLCKQPVLTKKSKHKIKELKNVEELFHPGGDSNHYCSMMTNMPRSYATYPLSQTSDRSKNRLAVFAVKLRESMKAYLSEKDDWPTSYYSELLLDTLLEDLTSTEIKDLDVWYGKHEMQEEVLSVSYKLTTDDKFLQNMMRSVDALPAKTEANLESVNGRSAEFFKTSVLYARRKLIPRLSFETSVIYRGTYGQKIPLSAMDDSCMILWWVKNKRPYQLFVTSSRDFVDVQRRMPASKISMVTFWSGRTSDVAQGGITMRDSATAGLGDQPPAPPRTLEQIPLQELYRPVPEEVLPPVTPPQIPAEQQIEVDDEDMQPPDQPQQSMQPPLTPPHGGLHVPLPDSPMQDSIPGSPGPPQDPPPPSPPPAGVPVQAPGSPLIHWYVAPWMPQAAVSHNQPPPPSPPPAAPMIAQPWMPPLWWPPVYPGPMPVAGGTFPSGGIPSSGGMMPLTITPSPVQPLQPMPPEPSQVSDDEEDIAEDQPMPAQPLLPARRPRADSVADPGVADEAPADVVPVAPPAEVPVQAGLPAPAVEAPVENAVAPASKKARQYDLPPQQPLQPMPQLQPQLPTSSSSPSALDDTTPTEPEAKKHKKHEDDDDEIDIDAPHQPTDPPMLPLSEHQTPGARSRLWCTRTEALKVTGSSSSDLASSKTSTINLFLPLMIAR